MQLPPQSQLSTIVKHYLIFERESKTQQNYRLFSDGNPGIVFHLKNPLLQYSKEKTELTVQPASFVYGQITDFNNLCSTGDLSMLVVVLQPYALYALFNLAAYELNNDTVPLADLFGQDGRDLEQQVAGVSNIYKAISLIEDFLIKRLDRMNALALSIKAAIHLIYRHRGLISVEGILKNVPVTGRQLERKFNEYVGTSPKKFADTVKLQYFLKTLQRHPDKKSLTEIVYQCGYYDQAHLNNYFKKRTGITPLEYKANQNLLAINLMPIQ